MTKQTEKTRIEIVRWPGRESIFNLGEYDGVVAVYLSSKDSISKKLDLSVGEQTPEKNGMLARYSYEFEGSLQKARITFLKRVSDFICSWNGSGEIAFVYRESDFNFPIYKGLEGIAKELCGKD